MHFTNESRCGKSCDFPSVREVTMNGGHRKIRTVLNYKNTHNKAQTFCVILGTYRILIDSEDTCDIRISLHWRHNELDGVSNHQPHDCLFIHLFTRRSKKTSKLCVTGLFVGNSPVTGEFPAQMASNAENVSIRWRHHVYQTFGRVCMFTCHQYCQEICTLSRQMNCDGSAVVACEKL